MTETNVVKERLSRIHVLFHSTWLTKIFEHSYFYVCNITRVIQHILKFHQRWSELYKSSLKEIGKRMNRSEIMLLNCLVLWESWCYKYYIYRKIYNILSYLLTTNKLPERSKFRFFSSFYENKKMREVTGTPSNLFKQSFKFEL